MAIHAIAADRGRRVLTFERTEHPDDWRVRSGGLTVGRIYRARNVNDSAHQWFWAINGVHAGPDVMAISGFVSGLDVAKAAIVANWEKWLTWAEL